MSLIDAYEGFVFDLDGTIYLGDELLDGAADVINRVRDAGKRIVYLTNKPLDPSSHYAEKLTGLGLHTEAGEVVSSLDSLVTYMKARHPDARVLFVSEDLVVSTLDQNGFRPVALEQAEDADVVVVSFDRTFDYAKLHAAYRAVRQGAVIVATNPDPYCPTPDGGLPDCAAMLAAIEAATGARAEAVLGKPSEYMVAAALERLGAPASRVLMIGDRLDTDVVMAHTAGMDSALVLSGVATEAEALASSHPPTFVLDSVSALLNTDLEPGPIAR